MDDADLTETYRSLSDEELLRRWSEGRLTPTAAAAARSELSRRGLSRPEGLRRRGAVESDDPLAFVTVARSMSLSRLQILKARLDAEGISSFVADQEMNRMISLYTVALGGMRLMVPRKLAAEASEIIALVKSGRLAYREGDDPS